MIVMPNMRPEALGERTRLLSALAQKAGREACGKDILSLSLGAAFYPHDGVNTERLLAEADKRMYVAKQHHYDHIELISLNVEQHPHLASIN